MEATTDRPGRYLLVFNLTNQRQIINGASRELRSAGIDLIVPPFDYVEVDEAEKWADDRNLARAVELGRVSLLWADLRPPHFPEPPPTFNAITDRRVQGMVREMVMGRDDIARDFITAEPRHENRPQHPLNSEWLKGTGWAALGAARDWLMAWGPPAEHQWRLDLINERLEFIRRLP